MFFQRLYGLRPLKNTLLISSKGSFICTIKRTERYIQVVVDTPVVDQLIYNIIVYFTFCEKIYTGTIVITM